MIDINLIARVCHEAIRVLQDFANDLAPSPSWEDAPDWQKASTREGVEKALLGATPEDLHNSWVAFKIADGWRFGFTKDAERKTHPCIVPYKQLPAEQKVKDQMFQAIVRSFEADEEDVA